MDWFDVAWKLVVAFSILSALDRLKAISKLLALLAENSRSEVEIGRSMHERVQSVARVVENSPEGRAQLAETQRVLNELRARYPNAGPQRELERAPDHAH